jgi:aminopeptidase
MDPRVERLAEILVGYSVDVTSGDVVMISADPDGLALVQEVYRKVLQRGGYPRLKMSVPGAARIYYEEASDEQLGTLLPIELAEYEASDCLISVSAPANLSEMANVNPAKLSKRQRAAQPISDWVMKSNVRWCGCNFPCNALAQKAEMSLAEYEQFVFGATNVDWPEISRKQEGIVSLFSEGREVRIVGEGTDLKFSIAGRPGINCDGHYNMPDGEVFFSPREDSAEGHITFSFPGIYMGREVEGIRLQFSGGRVVEAHADKNKEFLLEMLNTDPGAKYIGEFGIGTNPGITRFTRDILFDEKIGGTVHIALGQSYPEARGTNESAIHWDMIADLREGGEIHLDGVVVQRNGIFLK